MFKQDQAIRSGTLHLESIPFTGLLTNKILAALPGQDFANLLPHLEPVALNPGENLYEFGEQIAFVYFPETAVISHLYFLEDGGATAAAIIGNEGMVGLSAVLDNQPASYWTQVTIGGSAMKVDIELIVDEFNRSSALRNLLMAHTSARLAQVSQRAVCNSRHRLDERLCTWLLMIGDRASTEMLPLTHETIADHLGARRAGITGACNILRDSGIIDYRRGQMRILDRQKLEDAACECYQMLK
ncbi:MAG TPA: Crp/Fnr family transcriptional regulator [Pyrinomonadaceae bacterium]|nr:Crp/Fnr family transcriptional regulator [Pyrinomonadaceae bacterium]